MRSGSYHRRLDHYPAVDSYTAGLLLDFPFVSAMCLKNIEDLILDRVEMVESGKRFEELRYILGHKSLLDNKRMYGDANITS
ncbi:MAG: hypothetical protein VXV96_17675 [Bdellovibrionota bacterium]|nr:hypothetical protein [Bdellovibrionota bacterium]